MKKANLLHPGSKFNKLTFTAETEGPGRHYYGIFVCDCGTIKRLRVHSVRSGSTKSCGCHRSAIAKIQSTTHGAYGTTEHRIWAGMKRRCHSETDPAYSRYGGRGIYVCSRWRESFENFLTDMGKRPSLLHSVDRIDNDGPYSPENCRWSTSVEQQANRSNSRLLTYNGETVPMQQWAYRLGMCFKSLANRAKRGMTDEEIITTPRRNYRR